MAVDTSKVGASTGAGHITIERGPVTVFARAVGDQSPVYADASAAREAGFDGIPAPPTFGFAMAFWGSFPEHQPPDPSGGQNAVLAEVMGPLMAGGGLILHGEQEFEYHRPIVAGDVLVREGRVADIYERESKGRTMTFIVTEDVYTDERSGEPVLTSRMNLIHRS